MISAKIIKHSRAPHGKEIVTFELEYPRFVHSEFMTHRMLSKNAASSRAIPITTTIKQIQDMPALPVWWGKNQAGMSAKEELDSTVPIYREELDLHLTDLEYCKFWWIEARDSAIRCAKKLSDIGLHKQIANRILEPWVMIKVVATATEWDNFFYLRNHPDAQPEIHELARVMLIELDKSVPQELNVGEWHLPYVDDPFLDIESALKLSASLCAQVSYRKADESIDKAIAIYDKLVDSKPVHASPFEHQGTPLNSADERSGNFIGWEQHRQLIPGNVCLKYERD